MFNTVQRPQKFPDGSARFFKVKRKETAGKVKYKLLRVYKTKREEAAGKIKYT